MQLKFLMVLGSLLMAHSALTQELAVSNIPDSLKVNAYSVMRSEEESVEIANLTTGKRTVRYAVTILDEKGESDAGFRFYGDRFRELKSFSAKLYDANGKLLKKYGKSDLMFSEYSSELASDNKITYFECSAPSIPFTIQYEYEVAFKNGILGYGTFMPLGTFHQSVQRSTFSLKMPENMIPRIKSLNNMPAEKVHTDKGWTSRVWVVENLKALDTEPLNPSLRDLAPMLFAVPSELLYDGVSGSISTWKDMGNWSYNLTEGRDLLSDAAKAKVLACAGMATDEREKVKALYNLLGETTRYVSIQLGIGGYQPMTAAEVNKTGFGDCKALTNYLKAMLAVVGIPSDYCTIRFDDRQKELLADFPNFSEMNHVILKVPLKNDTLWLECTNPTLPFGYVHDGIAGHQVLVCRKDGSFMERLPDYADSLNLELHSAKVTLSTDGSANVQMYKECRVKVYEDFAWFPRAKASDQVENLRSDLHLPNVTMGSYMLKERKSALPSLKVDFNWTTPLYGSKTGNRLFLPTNIFRTGYDGLRRNKRTQDLCIDKGFRDADSITIQLPEGYEVENLPANVMETSKYGHFTSTVQVEGNLLRIVQVADVAAGRYKAAEFPEFMGFLNKISAAYKSKIIVRKKAA